MHERELAACRSHSRRAIVFFKGTLASYSDDPPILLNPLDGFSKGFQVCSTCLQDLCAPLLYLGIRYT